MTSYFLLFLVKDGNSFFGPIEAVAIEAGVIAIVPGFEELPSSRSRFTLVRTEKSLYQKRLASNMINSLHIQNGGPKLNRR